jgi:hypothetical protein
MSDNETFCEYCGYDSHDAERCTHCGHSLENPSGPHTPFHIPRWGRLKVHLQDPAATERIWQSIAEVWKTKVMQWWPHRELADMNPRDLGGGVLEFTGPDVLPKWLEEALQGQVTVTFQELPREQYPQNAVPYKLPRPPTVPRGKRKP